MSIDWQTIIRHFYKDEPELEKLLLRHSSQVRDKALEIAAASGCAADKELVVAGAMLHDIGIIGCHAPDILCNGKAHYITHGIIGSRMLAEYGKAHDLDLSACCRICERHTGSGLTAADIAAQNLPLPAQDLLPESTEEKLICLADKFFSKSGSMQAKSIEKICRSMQKHGTASLERFHALCADFGIKVQ